MPTLQPFLPFTPSTTSSLRAVPNAPRTPRLDAAFLAVPMQGQLIPGRFSASPRSFSRFEHVSEPYEASRRPGISRASMDSGVSVASHHAQHPLAFKHCSAPIAPKSTGTFALFQYELDPHETRDELRRQRLKADLGKIKAGAFVAGGWRKGAKVTMQCRQGELLRGVHRSLRADWSTYLRTTVDSHGFLQLLFEPLPEQRLGELRAYLNRYLEHNTLCLEFGLGRDLSRWGVPHATAEGAPALLFALRPPWVPNEPGAANERRTLRSEKRAQRAQPAAMAQPDLPQPEDEPMPTPAQPPDRAQAFGSYGQRTSFW